MFSFAKLYFTELIFGSAQAIRLKFFGKFDSLLSPTTPQPISPILIIFFIIK